MIGILDLEICNLASVSSAVYNLGFDFNIIKINENKKLDKISHLIIPGVGSFSNISNEYFNENNFSFELNDYVKKGKPVLGICLGMQFLATEGFENRKSKGLNLIEGSVNLMKTDESKMFNLPHVGWNEINITKDHSILKGIKNKSNFYFVHSYRMELKNNECLFAETKYLENFPSIVINNNVVGFQFHPEKSSKNGLKILENFCNWSI
jgi:imidazole glycerol-phosphate synthase subunit HisH